MNWTHLRTATASVLCALALSGCRGDVLTIVTVTGDDTAEVSVQLELDADAADAIAGTGESDLNDTIESRLGVVPERSRHDGGLTLTATVDYDTFIENSDVFGIESMRLAPGRTDDTTSVVIELVEPDALRGAIDVAVEDQPDADALRAALEGSTDVGIRVRFDGGVTDVRFVDPAGVARPIDIARSDTDVTIESSVSEYRPGTLLIEGRPHPEPSRWWVPVAAVAVIVAVGAYSARTLRNTERPQRPQRRRR